MNDEKNIEERLESVKDEIHSISWRIENLRDELDSLLAEFEREVSTESEECFGMLIEAGFVVGTKFQIDGNGSVWTITGICCDGYVVEYTSDNDGERKKTTLKTDSKSYLEKNLPRLKIVKSEVSE